MSVGAPVPVEIRLDRAARQLVVRFDDASRYVLPAEYLRVESPSAEVQGHGPGERRIVGGKRQVAMTTLEPVGNYAVRIMFDDGHDTGIFSWDYLMTLGQEQKLRWSAYLAALLERGLGRDPAS